MSLYEKIVNGKECISLIGLGYVGMPIAVAFSEKVKVIGYDVNEKKIEQYKNGIDPTLEVGNEKIKSSNVFFTSHESEIRNAKFHIVAVPTPITHEKTPDLTPVESASRTVGRNLTKGSIVVYESTVYPGATEDFCIPILEEESGLKCGVDFKVGYSPERINPGDKVNTLENITKIVSGIDKESLDEIAKIYEMVIKAGVHKASSIKVAEAAKVVENSQRDINIAFMNELAMVFDKMNIPTKDVIAAMNTKWNSLKFTPGLVGGHCIGVDPYYFISEAERLGYHSQIILNGRQINDGMGEFIAESIVKELILGSKKVKNSKVGILGFTFKEDCPDTRNTKVIDIIKHLKTYGVDVIVSDDFADFNEAKTEYGIDLVKIEELNNLDSLVIAVKHKTYLEKNQEYFQSMLLDSEESTSSIIDIKGILLSENVKDEGFRYWSL
ncbi:nucleotide sugar dehydrogenase [Vagococcus sp.]|uniref:nucleotide sugar dehydrogenase n=1 Tax=Vagococcus sp. TaxID=1933889 RepID=UPI002FCB27A9